jgi:hypothetical protein
LERMASKTMPSEREIWTRQKIFCNIEARMWTCLPYGRACEEGAARIFWQRGYWLSFLPSALYSTPNRQHEKQKLCKVVVSCLPAASSFQSRDKPTPSRKLNNFCRVPYRTFPECDPAESAGEPEGKEPPAGSHPQGWGSKYLPAPASSTISLFQNFINIFTVQK